MSPALLARLSELKNFNYIKDSGGDMTTHQQYLQTDCKVLDGSDTIAVYAFMAGTVGCIWGGVNYMPHECVRLYDLVQAGDIAGAMALWQKMLPSLLHIWTNDYMQCIVRAAHHRGYGLGNVRRPLRPLSVEAEAAMLATLQPLL